MPTRIKIILGFLLLIILFFLFAYPPIARAYLLAKVKEGVEMENRKCPKVWTQADGSAGSENGIVIMTVLRVEFDEKNLTLTHHIRYEFDEVTEDGLRDYRQKFESLYRNDGHFEKLIKQGYKIRHIIKKRGGALVADFLFDAKSIDLSAKLNAPKEPAVLTPK